MTLVTHKGSCHCNNVQFEFDGPKDIEAVTCDCSICSMTGFVHYFATEEEFRITSGKDNLIEYTFNTGTAKHLFCKTCGVKAFYVPRSHPDGWSVNVNCIDKSTIGEITLGAFEGSSWEDNIDSLVD